MRPSMRPTETGWRYDIPSPNRLKGHYFDIRDGAFYCGCGMYCGTVRAHSEAVRRAHLDAKWEDGSWFFDRVDKTESCWTWAWNVNPDGYGRLRVAGKQQSAHVVGYELANGPVPPGLEIDHLCRNRLCVRPSHLEAVTHRENMARGDSMSSRNAAKTHCKHGHEFTPENACFSRGRRQCRICQKQRSAAGRGLAA